MTRSGNSAQQNALHLFSRGLGGKEGPLMAEIYIFCFPIFFPNMSGISAIHTEADSWIEYGSRSSRVSCHLAVVVGHTLQTVLGRDGGWGVVVF